MFSVPPSLARWALLPLIATTVSATTFLADGYSIRIWQTEDGLPQNLVSSAVHTRDGYLWLGTYGGLVRFDGERFQVFDAVNAPEIADSRITALFEDASGTLWISQESGTLTRYHNARFETVPLRPEPTHNHILGMGSDEQGRLWAMRQNGVVDSLDSGARLPSLIGSDIPGIMSWSRSDRGKIWLNQNGRAARLENGKINPISFDSTSRSGLEGGVVAARDGGVWIARDNRIRKWKDGQWTEDRGEFPTESPSFGLELHDGTLAVGTVDAGLYLIFGDSRATVHLHRNNGLPRNWIRFVYEDREGTLWVGVGDAGLASVRPSVFSMLNSPDQWQGRSVHCVAPGRNGSLWIGTEGGGLYHYSAGQWSRYGEAEGLGPFIWGLTETPAGEVWAGNFWWGGPHRLEQGRFVRHESVEATSSPALSLLHDRLSGDLLVGTRDGLTRLQRDQSISLINSSEFPVSDATALAQDQQGTIWCGFSQGGLARVAGGKVTLFRRKDGLASDSVQSLFSDDDGTLWIGTADSGLTRYAHGRFVNLGIAQGLVDKAICHILDDGLGYFWLSTRHGLQRVAKAELNRCADGLIPRIGGQNYDQHDGLPTIQFTGGLQAAGCKTADGRLWFASSKGLVCVDPSRIHPNPTPPPVVIESLIVDGQPAAPGAVAERLPPDHQRLEFHFSGLSFVAPNKVLFKYRLEGIDDGWVDAGPKRTASYSRLPAGNYRFRVIACNNDGVWNSEGTALALTVAPFFWQTWWFVGSCTLLVIVSAAMTARYVTRRRLQTRMEHLERQHALERERARIARDIHDDIGTSLIRIALFSQPKQNALDHPQQTATVLARIYSTAREMTRALDEIVWAIDPRHDTLESLILYMGRLAEELLFAVEVRCRLDVPLEVPAWPLRAETRHNLFLAFKEALNNVVKHAAATEVRISVEVRSHDFILTLRDNGRGFDRERPQSSERHRLSSGNGLRNIEGRIAQIGGRCEIDSQFGKGTVISFLIPFRTPTGAPPRNAGAASSLPAI
jgi:signal transduction histidine kinase/ligand-binding sensor domain-containing protein